MAWNFGDSFDLYSAVADASGYWDGPGSGCAISNAGRFAGSRALVNNVNGTWLTKTSGVNDPVHHIVVAFNQTASLSSSTAVGVFFTLWDGATAQCSIYFRLDGVIVLTNGGTGGTVLATYTGAVPVASTWNAFEFEVSIGASTTFNARKNGNTVNDFTASGLNTQASANAYANKLSFGNVQNAISLFVDDLFWRSGAATGSWLGDIRCFTRMPASDIGTPQFAKFPAAGAPVTQLIPPTINGAAAAITSTQIKFTPFTAQQTGNVSSVGVAIQTGNSGSIKCAIYNDDGSGHPGTVLASANAPVTPVPTGTATFAFSSGTVTRGQQYWIGTICDTNVGNYLGSNVTAIGGLAPGAYATFPLPNPVIAFGYTAQVLVTYAVVAGNWQAVSEPQQDGLASYVFDSTPGDADFYSLSTIGSTPLSVIATTVRGYMQKSDAGTRAAAVQLKSGATTVATPTQPLSASGFQWFWRTDLVDPNTGAAWTAAAVTAAQIGPTVVA